MFKPFLKLSGKHALYLELQVKRDPAGSAAVTVVLYDPNRTGSYERIVLRASGHQAGHRDASTPSAAGLVASFGQASPQQGSTFVALPFSAQEAAALAQAPRAGDGKARRMQTEYAPALCTVHEVQHRLYLDIRDGCQARLLENPLPVDQRQAFAMGTYGENAFVFYYAVERGNVDVVRALLSQANLAGAGLADYFRATSHQRVCPLVLAAHLGHAQVLGILLDATLRAGLSRAALFELLKCGSGRASGNSIIDSAISSRQSEAVTV